MRRIALASLGCLLAAMPVLSEELTWQPAATRPAATLDKPVAANPHTQQPKAKVRGQVAETPSLGVPEPNSYPPPSYNYPPPGYYPPPAQSSTSAWPPANTTTTMKGDPVRRTSFSSRSSGTSTSRFGDTSFSEWCQNCHECMTADGRRLFESDHCMDFFSSPVTNPFLFEDPRALTEIRPVLIWQTIPSSNPVFGGGNAYYWGATGRVALTDYWSVTFNKLGGVTFSPDVGNSDSGMSEFWLGPKFTFLRNPETGSSVAAGLIFQIPTGPSSVFQDTGSLSLVPYISGAQNFGRNSYGSFNVMDTFGWSLAVDNDRSDFIYNSFHLDFDIVNAHRFYPFIELNWFHYTAAGNARAINQEGRDFANIGSTGIAGNDYLTIAPGFRYKFSEHVQTGIAAELPLTSPRDIQDFRLTWDWIFRY